uniref:Uncharacterized protein n=1 Tax=Anguilla anguilla TaxID=7936 RepID=A0A0E9UHS0_ANGAN
MSPRGMWCCRVPWAAVSVTVGSPAHVAVKQSSAPHCF